MVMHISLATELQLVRRCLQGVLELGHCGLHTAEKVKMAVHSCVPEMVVDSECNLKAQ